MKRLGLVMLVCCFLSMPSISEAGARFNFGFVPNHGLEVGEKVFTDSTIGLEFLGGAGAIGTGIASPPLFRLYKNDRGLLGFMTLEKHGIGEIGGDKQFSDTVHFTVGTTLIQYRNLKFGIHYKYTGDKGDFKDNIAVALSGSISGTVKWVQDLFTGQLL